MNVSSSSEYGPRPRASPNGPPIPPGVRSMPDYRNGSGESREISPGTASNEALGPNSSRAEKFEDEKKRIIESCFAKKEADGSLSESYITHIRVEEDAAYPSSPPPAQSASDNKKSRVIVIAVRKSGRVRMHKARENGNGSFSIGKTWVLDDLTVIESYTNATPKTAEQQQNKQRAGSVGFTVTVLKPYYWQAATSKEKDFFIFSLIKIFKKYTGGRLPQLLGFSSQEIDQLGGLSGAPQPRSASSAPPIPAPRVISREVPPARSSESRTIDPHHESSRDRRQRSSHGRSSPEKSLQGNTSQEPPRTLRSAVSQDRPLLSATSNDGLYVPGSFPSSESVDAQSSGSQRLEQPSKSPTSQADFPYPLQSRRHQPDPTGRTQALPPQIPSPDPESSPDNLRANGSVPPNLRVAPAHRPFEEAADRSIAPERKASTPTSPSTEKLIHSIPTQLTQRTYKAGIPKLDKDNVTSNGTAKASSVSRATRDRLIDESGPSAKSESNAEPVREHDRLTAASNIGDASTGDSFRKDSSQIANSTQKDPPQSEPVSSTPQSADISAPPDFSSYEHRPGLGPMIKKKSTKEIASTFRRAATAANAFKPRTTETLEKTQGDSQSVGDGITGVFQAPSLKRAISQDASRSVTPVRATTPRPSTPLTHVEAPAPQEAVSPVRSTTPVPNAASDHKAQSNGVSPKKALASHGNLTEGQRKRRRSDHSSKYASLLGIHPALLEGRTLEIEDVLNDFGWGGEAKQKASFEGLQSAIRKELANVEAGSWLGAVESNDDRDRLVDEMLDKVMTECEELDCLLTLYNVELSTLSEDVAYIEAQSQGLQVQTANQKLLHTELSNLLNTISISATDLRILKEASLAKTKDIVDVERTLAQLHAAMVTIDPKLRNEGSPEQGGLTRTSGIGHGGSDMSSMHAVRERREGYRRESIEFIQRFKIFISVKFRETEAQTLDALDRKRKSVAKTTLRSSHDHIEDDIAPDFIEDGMLDWHIRDEPKQDLWLYGPLLLFTREIEPSEWEDLLQTYGKHATRPYQDEYRENCLAWKRKTRKSLGNEEDVLFTSQEKEVENIVGRKLTVKRNKTVRSDGTHRVSSNEKAMDGKVAAYEAVAGALTDTAMSIFVEQNFVVTLFHASSTSSQDFLDAIATDPVQRGAVNPVRKMPYDTDRVKASKVLHVMEGIYSFWPSEMQGLVDWAVQQDTLNCVGILFALESQMASTEETNQEFLNQAVSKIHDRLAIHFGRFIEEQVRGIEDTKVKIKKRKGVIGFMKVFPNFTMTIENMLPPVNGLESLPVRSLVNEAYQTLNKAMFESLKYIAKETPSASATAAVLGDSEDKEALNHHILLIENMNHYVEEVSQRSNAYNPVLDDWNLRARGEMSEHMNSYLAAIIRRPLGKLLDYVESTESLIKNSPNPSSIATRASHSRSVFKKVLATYDTKELRKGIDTLKKRVEKHFGDCDDSPGLSSRLVSKVLKECQGQYQHVLARIERILREVYEGSLSVEWEKEDIDTAFKR